MTPREARSHYFDNLICKFMAADNVMCLYKEAESEYKMVFPGYQGRFIHGSGSTIAYWNVVAGSVVPEHRHPHEQIVNCLRGTFKVLIEGREYLMSEGDVVAIPANALHSAIAVTDAKILDVFTPVRSDYQF